MEGKDLEKKLQQSADNVQARDFEQVWSCIKDEIEQGAPQKKKVTFSFKRWLPAILSACVVLACAIGLPIYLNNLPKVPEEIVYYWDNLGNVNVQESVFNEKISLSTLKVVDFSKYTGTKYTLYQSSDNKVLGGEIELMGAISQKDFMATVKFYHTSVKLNADTTVYTQTYTTNGADIKYNKSQLNDVAYNYEIKATYNSINYYLSLTYAGDNVEPFLTEFFS